MPLRNEGLGRDCESSMTITLVTVPTKAFSTSHSRALTKSKKQFLLSIIIIPNLYYWSAYITVCIDIFQFVTYCKVS